MDVSLLSNKTSCIKKDYIWMFCNKNINIIGKLIPTTNQNNPHIISHFILDWLISHPNIWAVLEDTTFQIGSHYLTLAQVSMCQLIGQRLMFSVVILQPHLLLLNYLPVIKCGVLIIYFTHIFLLVWSCIFSPFLWSDLQRD